VRLHAALADPARLRIVDTLSLGDASPTDLQRDLGIASNLLAHHLGTLEDAGLIVRRRSEADRRRTYLRLDHERLHELLPDSYRSQVTVPRVVFVCTANTARSQLAAVLWNHASDVPATSAGTHPAESVAPGAVAVAARRGTALGQVAPRSLAEVLRDQDFVVTVCDRAHEELDRTSGLRSTRPTLTARSLHWSVPDPVPVGTRAAYDSAYDDLARRVTQLAPSLATP
jgi:ArsR family transcriptional regulator, arsenate/arsenite/antimonite-responsive transcriptional repressor / arsenate reductase (thioredoxin)